MSRSSGTRIFVGGCCWASSMNSHKPMPPIAPRSIATEPESTGDRKWDVMLAAVAEHMAYANDLPSPLWVRKPDREWLGHVWWVVDLPSARPWALAHSPAAFRRRGIFLHPDDLAVA